MKNRTQEGTMGKVARTFSADTGLKVVQAGTACRFLFDQKLIQLPENVDEMGEDVVAVVEGMLDHETCHAREEQAAVAARAAGATVKLPSELITEAMKVSKTRHSILNIVADIHDEMGNPFEGVERNLSALRRYGVKLIKRNAATPGYTSGLHGFGSELYLRSFGESAVTLDPRLEGAVAKLLPRMAELRGAGYDKVESMMHLVEQTLRDAMTQPTQPESQDGEQGESKPESKPQSKGEQGKADEGDEGEADEGDDGAGDDGAEDGEQDTKGESKGESDDEGDEGDEGDDGEGGAGEGEDEDGGDEGEEGDDGAVEGEDGEEGNQEGSAGKGEQEGTGEDQGDQEGGEAETGEAGGNVGASDNTKINDDPTDSKPVDDLFDDAAKDMMDAVRDQLSKDASSAAQSDGRYVARPSAKAADKIIVQELSSDAHYAQLKQMVAGVVGGLRSKLMMVLKGKADVQNDPDQEEGKLDSAALYRAVTGERRVFSRKITTLDEVPAVAVLVDESGSMGGVKAATAQLAAVALGETLTALNVPFAIYGFTSGMVTTDDDTLDAGSWWNGRNESIHLYQYKSFSEQFRRVRSRLVKINGRANNADGDALQMVADLLAQQPQERKVLIVLSDGQPAAGTSTVTGGTYDPKRANVSGNYTRRNERERSIEGRHLKDVVRATEKRGIEVVGIGIQSDAVTSFYRNAEVVWDLAALPKALFKAVAAKLMNGRVRRVAQ